ncbi:hypothetical protein RUND412_005447 [Rhizina undulata]
MAYLDSSERPRKIGRKGRYEPSFQISLRPWIPQSAPAMEVFRLTVDENLSTPTARSTRRSTVKRRNPLQTINNNAGPSSSRKRKLDDLSKPPINTTNTTSTKRTPEKKLQDTLDLVLANFESVAVSVDAYFASMDSTHLKQHSTIFQRGAPARWVKEWANSKYGRRWGFEEAVLSVSY